MDWEKGPSTGRCWNDPRRELEPSDWMRSNQGLWTGKGFEKRTFGQERVITKKLEIEGFEAGNLDQEEWGFALGNLDGEGFKPGTSGPEGLELGKQGTSYRD